MNVLRDRRVHYVALGLLALLAVVLSALALFRSVPPTVAATPQATPTTASASPSATSTATTAPSPTRTATPATMAAVFLGDRYTAGASWPDQTGQAAGWATTNLAEPGMGYRVAPATCQVRPCAAFRGQVARVAASRPGVVVLAGGEADGDFDLEPYAASTIAEFRRALPDATIVVMSPLSSQSPRPYWLTLHAQTLRSAAQKSGALFVDTTEVTGRPAAFNNGALTEAAGAELARLLSTAVSRAGSAQRSR